MSTEPKTPPPTPSVSFAGGPENVQYQSFQPPIAPPPSAASSVGPATANSSPAKPATPTIATSISQYAAQLPTTSFANALYEGDNGDQDGCLPTTPDPEDEQSRTKFRRGWAASPSSGEENTFQASTRSNESVLKKYRTQYSGKSSERKTEQWKEEHPNRPSGARWKQQNLPAWQPIYRPVNVIGTFLGFGVFLISIGVLMLISNIQTKEVIYDYTYCNSTQFPAKTCAEVLEKKLQAPANASCTCIIPITIPESMTTPVYLYYSLDGFYQNHRRYVSSVDHKQLLGKPLVENDIVKNCYPFDKDSQEHYYAPCGAIANSFFTDEFSLKFGSSQVKIKETDIAWITDKRTKFHNPSNWDNTVHPRNWTINAAELDPTNPENTGYQNEHFIVWMRTAAFPRFRKLWGRIEPESVFKDRDVLPAGTYTVEVKYNFPTVLNKLNIPKKLIISNTSWLGGRNIFLSILYLVVGGLSVLSGILFLVLVWRTKRTKDKILPQTRSLSPNYQTMSSTDGVQFTSPLPPPSPIQEEDS